MNVLNFTIIVLLFWIGVKQIYNGSYNVVVAVAESEKHEMTWFCRGIILQITLLCFSLPVAPTLIPITPSLKGLLAFHTFLGNIHIIDLSTMEERQLTNYSTLKDGHAPQAAQYPSFSPDGKQIAFVEGPIDDEFICGLIYLMDTNGNNIQIISEDAITSFPVSWSPDGKQIIYEEGCLYGDGSISTIDVITGEITHLRSGVQQPVWSPDGSQIALLSGIPLLVILL